MGDCKGWPVLRYAVLSECQYIKDYKNNGTIHLFSSELYAFFPTSLLVTVVKEEIQKASPFFSTSQEKGVITYFVQKDAR